MAAKIGSANLVHGCTDETYGYVQSFEIEESSTATDVKNGAGNVVGVGYTGNVHSCSGEYIVIAAAGFGDPVAQVGTGTAITMADAISPGDIYIESATKSKTVDNFLTVSFSGRYFPNLA